MSRRKNTDDVYMETTSSFVRSEIFCYVTQWKKLYKTFVITGAYKANNTYTSNQQPSEDFLYGSDGTTLVNIQLAFIVGQTFFIKLNLIQFFIADL